MNAVSGKNLRTVGAAILGALALLTSAGARAQEAAPEPAASPAETTEATAATAVPPAPEAAAKQIALADSPPVVGITPETTVAAPAPPPAPLDGLNAGIWMRLGARAQDRKDPNSLGDIGLDGSEVNALFSGEVHPAIKWQADFVATFGPTAVGGNITGDASVLDLIGKIEPHESVNLWIGRMLVPSDRSNFSGPWFMSAWNYPGFYQAYAAPVGPRQGPFGRNDGATLWGQFGGGLLKYYASAFDLHDPDSSPLYSGRINLSLLNPEPGYYNSSTYYGDKDIVALGIGGQAKRNGSIEALPAMSMATPGTDDYLSANADLLIEKTLGRAGTATFEAAYYHFAGDHEAITDHYYGLVSYLLPGQLGPGRLQPLIRVQQALPSGDGDPWTLIDGQVSYVVAKYAARLAVNYQRSDVAGVTGNALQFGLQIQR